MDEQITPMTDQDAAGFDEMRNFLVGLFTPETQVDYDTLDEKLAIVDAILGDSRFDPSNVGLLQALGVCFGDAISQQLGMEWVIVTNAQGRFPALNLPGTSLKVYAFTTIQKRVENGEEFDAISLFEAFCRDFQSITQPKRSLLGRIFGSRLT
jgi:Domain of unknown function (DUF3806)